MGARENFGAPPPAQNTRRGQRVLATAPPPSRGGSRRRRAGPCRYRPRRPPPPIRSANAATANRPPQAPAGSPPGPDRPPPLHKFATSCQRPRALAAQSKRNGNGQGVDRVAAERQDSPARKGQRPPQRPRRRRPGFDSLGRKTSSHATAFSAWLTQMSLHQTVRFAAVVQNGSCSTGCLSG